MGSWLLKWLPCALLLLGAAQAHAADEALLNSLFTDNMVLQRDVKVPVWGSASPGAQVTVSFNGQEKKAITAPAGKWMTHLEPMKAGGPFVLSVTDGKTTLRRSNVMVGEVWLCSGQSNMEFPVSFFAPAQDWLKDAAYPQVRFLTVKYQNEAEPADRCVTAGWQVCDSTTAASFSATGFLFGRALHKAQQVPVGIISSAIAGTTIQPWMSRGSLQTVPDAAALISSYDKAVQELPAKQKTYNQEMERRKSLTAEQLKTLPALEAPNPGRPFSGFFNGMISPLMPYGLRGIVWYQGESNAMFAQGEPYRRYLVAMIRDWRTRWNSADLPFLVVQLPGYGKSNGTWPELRDSQLAAARSLPNIGLAVTIDLGDNTNVHPNNKQDVAARLLLQARKAAYGEQLVAGGPIYKSMAVGADGKVALQFDSMGGGLVARGNADRQLACFTIAGADQRFVPANARIQGDQVLVWSDRVKTPAAVRFAWEDNPAGFNFYNQEGLPAVPFRTDDWKLRTQPK